MARRTHKRGRFSGNAGQAGKSFWNQEYDHKTHLMISDNPSSDLQKFFRWLTRYDDYYLPTRDDSVLDIGCGNGRNILYVCETYQCRGIGYDISQEAITQAGKKADTTGCDITFIVQDVAQDIAAPDGSQKLVLDMMVSHVLRKNQRKHLLAEIHRVLEPGGFLFLKTFLRDGDLNVRHLIEEFPGTEEGSYIHPKIGIEEHAFFQDEIEEDVAAYFTILKVYTSHKHRDKRGRANKRRSIAIYAQKPDLL